MVPAMVAKPAGRNDIRGIGRPAVTLSNQVFARAPHHGRLLRRESVTGSEGLNILLPDIVLTVIATVILSLKSEPTDRNHFRHIENSLG
ncbi:MAG TPA: hypothetical protein VIM63_12480 [Rhodoferax sp.]